ncbi:MAG: EAL domain-containing protein [Acidimicrobiales bacterium]
MAPFEHARTSTDSSGGPPPGTWSGALVVHYQPIVDLVSRDVRLVEALARLELGGVLVSPEDWVPAAERSGDIDWLGCQVLRTAVADLLCDGDVEAAPGLTVNVSPHQLHSQSLLACVQGLGCEGIVLARLCLEITECAVVDDRAAMVTVRDLRSLGCKIALDDFGTGYSSLHALSELPVDVLKLDRRLVARLPGAKAATVLGFVLELAGALGLEVVAEGIETASQLEALVELGFTLGQGYLLGRPGPLVGTARPSTG